MRRDPILLIAPALMLALLVGCSDDPSSEAPADGGDVVLDTSADATDTIDSGVPTPDADSDADGPDGEEPDAGPDVTEEVIDEICPGSLLCINEVSGNPSRRICLDAGFPEGTECVSDGEVACCVPPFQCTTDETCEAARATEEFCADPRYPCTCDVPTGECRTTVCTADADCGDSERCLDGLCEAAPDPSALVARILSAPGFAASGDEVSLVAVAVDPNDASVVDASAEIAWLVESRDGSVVTPSGVVTVGTGIARVRARVAANAEDAGDTVEIYVAPASASDALLVWVFDENRRVPLEGARVLVGASEFVTGGDGTVSVPTAGPSDVHVFAEGYAHVSVLGVEGRSVAIPLPVNARAQITRPPTAEQCVATDASLTATFQSEGCGGPGEPDCLCFELENVDVVAGAPSFAELPAFGDTEVTISGFSLGNSLLDLNFDLILGPSVDRTLGPPINQDGDIPSGVTLRFNGDPLIGTFVATAPVGARSLWTIGGRIALNDILLDVVGSLSGDLDIGAIIATVLPFFENFYSDVSPRLPLLAEGTFPVRDPELALSVPTQRRVAIEVPTLPELDRGYADTLIVLGGALVPGEGFVPLGITGGADATGSDTADGEVDGDTSTPEKDPLAMAMAPMHGPTLSSGSRYMFAGVSLLLDDYDGAPREASSGLIRLLEPGAPLPSTVQLGGEGFPAFALGSAWGGADASRTLSLGEGDAGFDLLRVVFRDDQDHLWIVYAPGDTNTIAMPSVEAIAPAEDRTAADRVNVVGITLRDGTSYDALLTADATHLGDLFTYVSGFSILGL